MPRPDEPPDRGLRAAVAVVAALNLAFFAIEFAMAGRIGSVALFADSIDFLEDTAINALILIALRWDARARARVGTVLAALLLAPAAATLWAAWNRFADPLPPAAVPLGLTAAAALAVNVACAVVLARHRRTHSSLARAAWLSARNDALADLAIIAAGVATALSRSAWPDLLVGLGIFALNLHAARTVFVMATRERGHGVDQSR